MTERTKHANQAGAAWVFRALTSPPIQPAPATALQAKRCRCETPWLERDADEQLHCCRCGLDYRP